MKHASSSKESTLDIEGIVLALRAAEMGTWRWDIPEDKRSIDEVGCRILGINPVTFGGTGEEFFAAIHPDDRANVKAALQRTLKEDAPYLVKYRVVWVDGSTHFIMARAGLQRDEAGQPERITGIFWDATDDEEVQVAFKNESARLQIILETVADPIFVKDSDYRFVLANAAFYALLGLEPATVIGKTLAEHLTVDEMEHFLAVDRHVLDTGEPDLRQEPLTIGGMTHTLVTKKSRFIDQYGKKFLVGAIHDVTARKEAEMKNIEINQLLSMYVKNSPIYTYIKTVSPTESRVVMASNNFHEMFGGPVVDIDGKTMSELFPADMAEKITADDWRTVSTGKVLSIEESYNGKIYSTIKFPIVQSGKHLLAGYTIDITDKKEAEKELKRSAEQLIEAQQIARIGSYVLNTLTGEWTASIGLDAVFGIDASHVHDVKGWEELVHPEDRIMMANYFADEVLIGVKPFDKYYRIIRKSDGEVRWVHGLGKVIRDALGKAVEMHGTIQDVTQIMEAQKRLEQSRIAAANVLQDLQDEKTKLNLAVAKDDAVLASIGDGLVVTDNRGRILLVNAMFERILGWTSAEVIGKMFTDVIPLTDEAGVRVPEAERIISMLLSDAPGAGLVDVLHDFQRKNGTRFPVVLTITSVMLGGKSIGAVEVFRDITKERAIDRTKSEFISIASHQLRTPVSSLRWIVEALQKDIICFNPKQQQYLHDLSLSADRLVELVDGLLDVSRIQMKSPDLLQKEKLRFPETISKFLMTIESFVVSKKHIVVVHDALRAPRTLELNKKALYIVLQNLISNAIEYSPEHSTVTVTVAQEGGGVKVSIHNTGSVISDEDTDHVFERFYRGAWARKVKVSGAGLGLYISKILIQEEGGDIGFQSDKDAGTTFWFTLGTH